MTPVTAGKLLLVVTIQSICTIVSIEGYIHETACMEAVAPDQIFTQRNIQISFPSHVSFMTFQQKKNSTSK